jgi:DNA (cytosine-5)-methyltransferase 1
VVRGVCSREELVAAIMTNRPRLLDLFCGAGGAAVGYHRAGFDVTGVDINPQPRYPFEFHQADALLYLSEHSGTGVKCCGWLDGFDVIHASPPCQHFTQMNATHRGRAKLNRPDLLTPTLEKLRSQPVPYVVENVPGAKAAMRATLTLDGGMFGLGVHRPRLFECSQLVLVPRPPINHKPIGVYGQRPEPNGRTRLNGDMSGKRSVMRIARNLAEAHEAMGIDWMTWDELKEAIPPAYTEYIGRQLLEYLAVTA